jgi:uncharacterized protein (DUF2345 family)
VQEAVPQVDRTADLQQLVAAEQVLLVAAEQVLLVAVEQVLLVAAEQVLLVAAGQVLLVAAGQVLQSAALGRAFRTHIAPGCLPCHRQLGRPWSTVGN